MPYQEKVWLKFEQLMFDFEITLFWIYSYYWTDLDQPSTGYIATLGSSYYVTTNSAISLSAITKNEWVDSYIFYHKNNNGRRTKIWFRGNTLKWYRYSDSGNNSDAQFNTYGKRYYWLAL